MSLNGRPPYQKTDGFDDKEWRRLAIEGESCALRLTSECQGAAFELHHLRYFESAGMGMKPPDFLSVLACRRCHDAMHRHPDQWDWDDVLRAFITTILRLVAKGLLVPRKGNR